MVRIRDHAKQYDGLHFYIMVIVICGRFLKSVNSKCPLTICC